MSGSGANFRQWRRALTQAQLASIKLHRTCFVIEAVIGAGLASVHFLVPVDGEFLMAAKKVILVLTIILVAIAAAYATMATAVIRKYEKAPANELSRRVARILHQNVNALIMLPIGLAASLLALITLTLF